MKHQVRQLMAKSEPEVIQAIMPERHTDNDHPVATDSGAVEPSSRHLRLKGQPNADFGEHIAGDGRTVVQTAQARDLADQVFVDCARIIGLRLLILGQVPYACFPRPKRLLGGRRLLSRMSAAA